MGQLMRFLYISHPFKHAGIAIYGGRALQGRNLENRFSRDEDKKVKNVTE